MPLSLISQETTFINLLPESLMRVCEHLAPQDASVLAQVCAHAWAVVSTLPWQRVTVVENPACAAVHNHDTRPIPQQLFENPARYAAWFPAAAVRELDYVVETARDVVHCDTVLLDVRQKFARVERARILRRDCVEAPKRAGARMPRFVNLWHVVREELELLDCGRLYACSTPSAKHFVRIIPTAAEPFTGQCDNVEEMCVPLDLLPSSANFGGLKRLTVQEPKSFRSEHDTEPGGDVSCLRKFLAKLEPGLDKLTLSASSDIVYSDIEKLASRAKRCELLYPFSPLQFGLPDPVCLPSIDTLTLQPKAKKIGQHEYEWLSQCTFPNLRHANVSGVPFSFHKSLPLQILNPESMIGLVSLCVSVFDPNSATKFLDAVNSLHSLKFLEVNVKHKNVTMYSPNRDGVHCIAMCNFVRERELERHAFEFSGGVRFLNQVCRLLKATMPDDIYSQSADVLQSSLKEADVLSCGIKTKYNLSLLIKTIQSPVELLQDAVEKSDDQIGFHAFSTLCGRRGPLSKVSPQMQKLLDCIELETLWMQAFLELLFRGLANVKTLETLAVNGPTVCLESPWLAFLVERSTLLQKIWFSSCGHEDCHQGIEKYENAFDRLLSAQPSSSLTPYINKALTGSIEVDAALEANTEWGTGSSTLAPLVNTLYTVDVAALQRDRAVAAGSKKELCRLAVAEYSDFEVESFGDGKTQMQCFSSMREMGLAASFGSQRQTYNVVHAMRFV